MITDPRHHVLTAGTFDLFHHGHVAFLKQCASLGRVTVAVNSDRFVAQFKSHATIMTWAERAKVVEGCRYVDRVISAATTGSLHRLLCDEKPDILAIGTDWVGRDYYKQIGVDAVWLEKQHITLVYLPYTTEISTTNLIDRCVNSQPYSLVTETLTKSDDPTGS